MQTRLVGFFIGIFSVASLFSCLSTEDPASAAKVPLRGRIVRNFGISVDPYTGRESVHPGIDIAAAKGTIVRAVGDGVVEEMGTNEGQGNYVIVRHEKAKSFYAQLDEALVASGESVKRGEPIGKSGNTGKSASPHLHFGIYVDNTPIDPVGYIDIR